MNDIQKAIEYFYKQIEFGCTNDYYQRGILETAIEILEEKLNSGWIPCSERLPVQKDGRGVWVLTYATSGLIETNHFCNGEFYEAIQNGYEITAWQPLPEKYDGGLKDE